MPTRLKKALKDLPWRMISILCLVVGLGVIDGAWQINNPKANQMTLWTHFGDALQFKKLSQFQ